MLLKVISIYFVSVSGKAYKAIRAHRRLLA